MRSSSAPRRDCHSLSTPRPKSIPYLPHTHYKSVTSTSDPPDTSIKPRQLQSHEKQMDLFPFVSSKRIGGVEIILKIYNSIKNQRKKD